MDNPIGSDGLPARDSGSWAQDKLIYLKRYLDIFTVGMKNKWNSKLYYVDLFSGPGICQIPETRIEFNGSPLIALDFAFTGYFFFESDPDCFVALRKRIEKRFPKKLGKIELINADCNARVGEINFPSSNSLGTAFIDPTGLAPLPFSTVKKLTDQRKIDLIINFHEGMGVRMNLHQYTGTDENALRSFMGSDRWKEKFRSKPHSFNETCRTIAKEYLENLRGLGYLASDNNRIPIRTEKETLLYYLLFASKHPRGTDFWKKIKLIDSRGQRHLPGFNVNEE